MLRVDRSLSPVTSSPQIASCARAAAPPRREFAALGHTATAAPTSACTLAPRMTQQTWSTSHTLNYAEDDQMLRRHSADLAASIHTEGMTPRSRRLATTSDDITRAALLSGQVRFPPNGWWSDSWFYVKNNHVFISIFLAHPSHPYTRGRRFLVLLNSLSFAFFVTALFQVIIPVETLRIAVVLVYGTLAQIMWDVPAAMLGTCPCAHMACLPPAVQRLSNPTPTPTPTPTPNPTPTPTSTPTPTPTPSGGA